MISGNVVDRRRLTVSFTVVLDGDLVDGTAEHHFYCVALKSLVDGAP